MGIIGVVAAMTLPVLISNHQKKVYVTQLKKSVSVLSNGFKLMMAHDGVTEMKDTDAFSGAGDVEEDYAAYGCTTGRHQILTNNCSSFREGLQSVFSGIKFTECDGSSINNLNGANKSNTSLDSKSTNNTCIEFPDGSEIFYLSVSMPPQEPSTNIPGGRIAQIVIDINGPKNPNTIGRDIFWLYLGNNGAIYPRALNWRGKGTDSSSACIPGSKGLGCAARVLEEDAMNY